MQGVPVLGHYLYSRARQGLHEHAHPGCLEICFLVKGRQTYRIGTRDYTLAGGDIFLPYRMKSIALGACLRKRENFTGWCWSLQDRGNSPS